MKLSRDLTLLVHVLFDELLPPALRDSRWFMWLPFKVLFRDRARLFAEFKDKAPFMSEAEFTAAYRDASPFFIRRATDLNRASVELISARAVGGTVLDIACGRGYLARLLAERFRVTAADIMIDEELARANPGIHFDTANVESLPYADGAFDTVVCAHTLEHVQHLPRAVSELRRVCARRLIVVVPRQRPYRFTFDLHLHFFPYASNLLTAIGPGGVRRECVRAGGDWVYIEDRS